jgi:transcriptional regulator with XRE-family HTH domain
MQEDVSATVERLKQRFHATTDQELAEKLDLGRSTVTSWRRRGSVPARYAKLAEGEVVTPFGMPWTYWTEEENAALSLALLRHGTWQKPIVQDYGIFLSKSGFIVPQLLSQMQKALGDLRNTMRERGIEDPRQCLSMMVWEEFFANP